MNDDWLRHEIEKAFAVEPSPQFLARVRRHIASERRTRGRRLPWIAPSLGIAAVIVAVILVLPSRHETPSPSSAGIQPGVPDVPTLPPKEAHEPVARAVKPQVVHTLRRSEPEVLIDPREAAAFRNFLEDVHEKKIDPSSLAGLLQAAEKARLVEDIAPMPIAGLEPIHVPPLESSVPVKEGESL
jgi:hypothetical protein